MAHSCLTCCCGAKAQQGDKCRSSAGAVQQRLTLFAHCGQQLHLHKQAAMPTTGRQR